MRTKILLLGAAALAMGLASSNAQPVYSANVVGYVQENLVAGFNMIANPLDLDGKGTNNTLQTTFGTQLPSGAAVYAFQSGAFVSPPASFTHGNWGGSTNAANAALNPGGGVFVQISAPTTVTFVGNVLQGSLSNPYNAGFNIISSQVPIAGLMQHTLNFTPVNGNAVYVFNSGTQAYGSPPDSYTHGAWNSEPNLAIGQAVFLNVAAGSTWNTNFTVQ